MTSGNERSTEVADDFLATLCRGLNDDNKFSRKDCLVKIRSSINERSSEEDFTKAFEVVFKDVLRSFKDPSEACREIAILLVTDALGKVLSVEPFLTFIITVVAKRIGLDDVKESSEEIRLLLIKMLIVLLKKSSDCNLTPCLDDLATILCKSLADNFPDVKLASCECTKLLANTIPKQFHVQSETYLKALIPGAVHKHNKIRTAFISTIGIVVRFGTHNLVEKVAPVLAERLYDSNPSVRKEVISTGGEWLLNLPDRYGQFCRIIPLVVTGLDDEMPEVQDIAQNLWDLAGHQYEMENEEELKNELDYGITSLTDYPISEPRPRVGCRALMQKQASAMVSAIMRELHDWNAGVRMQSASLLYQLVRHLETRNIGLLQKFWPDLCLKCVDKCEPQLKLKVEQTVMLLGYFSPIDALLPVALPQEELTKSQLCCLAATLKGVTSLSEPHLLAVCQALAKSNNTNMELDYQCSLLHCASQTLKAMKRCSKVEVSKESSLALFAVLLNLKGNSQSIELSTLTADLFGELASSQEIESAELFKRHGADTLAPIPSTIPIWTEHCAFKNIFMAFVHGSGTGIGPLLPLVAEILVSWAKSASTGVDLADMLRVSMPILSWKFLESCNVDPEPFLKTILFDVIKPNLKWSAGRVSEARRSQALVLLTVIIAEPQVSNNIISALIPDFPPLVTAMLEETSKDPRLGAGRVLQILCRRWRKLNLLDLDTTFKIVKVAAERLDDTKTEVRLQALQVLEAALPSEVPKSYSSHLQLLFKTALIHLDDQDKNYRLAVFETLKVISLVDIPMVKTLLITCRKHFSNQELCDDLSKYLQTTENAFNNV